MPPIFIKNYSEGLYSVECSTNLENGYKAQVAAVSWKAAGNFESSNLRLLDDSSNSTRKNDVL